MLTGTEKFRFFGFSFVALMGMIFLGNLILHYPVSSELSEERKEELIKLYGERAVSIDEEMKNAEQIYLKLERELRKIPKFVPPENNHLTEDQIQKHYQIVDHCWKRFKDYRRNYLEQIPERGLARGLAMVFHGPALLALCQAEGLLETKMTGEEFDWVGKRMWEAALFAVNQKFKSGKVQSEEMELLKIHQEQLCQLLGLVEESDQIYYLPEKLDLSKIPRHNVELFLRFKNQVRWRKINFETIEFDYQNIMNAAQILPE